MKKLALTLGLFLTVTAAHAQKAYPPGYDDSKPYVQSGQIDLETNLELYKPILTKLRDSLRAQLGFIQHYIPGISVPARVVIRDVPFKANGIHYYADNDNKSTSTGSIQIYEGEINDPLLEGMAMHEYIHALLRANWGPDDKSLIRRSLEEMLCDLYVRLMRPDIPLVEGWKPRSFDIPAPFKGANDFTQQHARDISENDDYLKPFSFTDTMSEDNNSPHHVLAPVRRYLNVSQLDRLTPALKLYYFQTLVLFFRAEILNQAQSFKIKNAYDFNRIVIEKLEKRR